MLNKKEEMTEIRGLGAGDTSLHLNVFDEEIATNYFNRMLESYHLKMNENENNNASISDLGQEFACDWEDMINFGRPVARLVCVQAEPTICHTKEKEVMAMPMYRHPIDVHPSCRQGFSPLIGEIVQKVRLKFNQPFNHALIQLYRSGEDNISSHTDKTLDIEPGTSIVNVSFGASREFTIKSKVKLKHGKGVEKLECVALPHNSILLFGLESNKLFTHQVHQDIRKEGQKRSDENSFGGIRISITVRVISTYLTECGRLFGLGAKFKTFKALQKELCSMEKKTSSICLKHHQFEVFEENKEEEEISIAAQSRLEETCAKQEVEKNAEEMYAVVPTPSLASLWPLSENSALMQYPSIVEYDVMSKAFQRENREGESFDWASSYGQGFDVLDKADALKKANLTLYEAVKLANTMLSLPDQRDF